MTQLWSGGEPRERRDDEQPRRFERARKPVESPASWDAPPWRTPRGRRVAPAPPPPRPRRAAVAPAADVQAAIAPAVPAIALLVALAGGGQAPPRQDVVTLPSPATGIAAAGGRVWVAMPETGAVLALDADSGLSLGPPIRIAGTPARLALGAGGAWA